MQEAQSRPQEDELPRNRGWYQGKPLPLDGLLKPEWLYVDKWQTNTPLSLLRPGTYIQVRCLTSRLPGPDSGPGMDGHQGALWAGLPHLPGPANSSTSSRKVRVPTNLTQTFLPPG